MCAVHAPALLRLDRVSWNPDWILHLANHAYVRKAILDFREFPFWAPYFGGGFPFYAHPETPCTDPLVVLSVLFGEVIGVKLIALCVHLAGVLGMFWLMRLELGADPLAALFSGAILAGGGWAPEILASGNLNELWWLLLPLLLLCFMRAHRLRSRCATAGGGVLLALAAMDGKTIPLLLAMFMGGMALLHSFAGRGGLESPGARRIGLVFDRRPLQTWFLMCIIGLAVAMVKVLPALLLLSGEGGLMRLALRRPVGEYVPERIVGWGGFSILRHLVQPAASPAGTGRSLLLVGWVPALMGAAGVVLSFRRAWRWAVLGALAFILSMGPKSPVDLFRLLHALPVLNTLRFPMKYFSFPLLFVVMVLGSYSLVALQERLRRSFYLIAGTVLIFVSVVALYPHAARSMAQTATAERPSVVAVPEFFQISVPGTRRGVHNQYITLQQNIGLIDWYSQVKIPESATPRYFVEEGGLMRPNPTYRGETYLLNGHGRAHLVVLKGNDIRVLVEASRPDVLIVNQNYHRYWRCDAGEVFSTQGLLGVRLGRSGTFWVRFRFLPLDWLAGLAISAAAGIGTLLWAIGLRHRARGSIPPAQAE